jgi:hypothetical protein
MDEKKRKITGHVQTGVQMKMELWKEAKMRMGNSILRRSGNQETHYPRRYIDKNRVK